MEVITQKNLQTLIDMGFEVTCKSEDFIKLYNGEYDVGIDLYKPHEKDTYTGIYMDITKNNVSIKECKGRNVISNISRYIKRQP